MEVPASIMPLFGRTQYLRGAVVLTLKHTFLSVGLVSFRYAVTTSVKGPGKHTGKRYSDLRWTWKRIFIHIFIWITRNLSRVKEERHMGYIPCYNIDKTVCILIILNNGELGISYSHQTGHVYIFSQLYLHLAADGEPSPDWSPKATNFNSNITPKANYARIPNPVTPDPTLGIETLERKLRLHIGRVKLRIPLNCIMKYANVQ